MFDVAVVGSANLDLVATTHRLPHPGETLLGRDVTEHAGGKGLNQAVAAARCGARVALIGALGDDEAGRSLRIAADDEGIDTDRLVTVDGLPTGRALITVDDAGENTIIVIPGANAGVDLDQVPTATVCLAQLEIPVSSVLAAFVDSRHRGALTVLNPAPAGDLSAELLAACSIVVPNEHELELLGGPPALLAAGVETVIVTRGAAGVLVIESSGASWEQAAFPVTAIDTTGAGDAFCGALATRLARGDDLRTCVRYAAAAGALATTVAGAVPSLPRARDVETVLES